VSLLLALSRPPFQMLSRITSVPQAVCAAADFFHGDKPDLEAIFNGDFSGFMAWRERHAADTILPDAERVRFRIGLMSQG